MATSVVSEGKIRAMRNREERVPEGWILNHRGQPTTNPNDFYGPPPGALLPLGGTSGYKGFGLGLIIDILAGGLSTAGCSRPEAPEEPESDGILIIVMDIEGFTPLPIFHQRVMSLVEYIKSSPTAPGFEAILVPGEAEYRERQERLQRGIFIDEATWRQIRRVMEEVGVSDDPELGRLRIT
jgi:uncharacterized oxidoreductase